MRQTNWLQRWGGRATRVLILGATVGAMSGCDDLLEVEIPHLLTDAAIEGQGTAETQVMSAIALFECGYTAFGLMAIGHEDAMESIAGVFSGGHVYDATPNTGTCDTSDTSTAWFDQIMGARSVLTTNPGLLTASAQGTSRGVYDRINNEWSLGAAGERLSAISAIYVAASLSHIGEFLCEAAIDGSDLLTPTEVLQIAENWADVALGHIGTFGDFAMPNGVATSAQRMALAVRARIRWAQQDLAGAAADAQTVLTANPTFASWVTREAGPTRRNKIYSNATAVGFSGMVGINDWWNPAIRPPNPATGQIWANPIPFNGYIFLGIMPDGRALEAGNLPVRWAQQARDASNNPISLGNGAVADNRVTHRIQSIQGPGLQEVPTRYSNDADDIPYMTWQELRLIQADRELEQNNFAGAIGHVNAIRTAAGLPTISGAYQTTLTDGTNDFAEVRAMLLEERRREFFAEGGRYWSTKIQNTDMLWFPRNRGQTQQQGYNMVGSVRQLFATGEYLGNSVWRAAGGEALQATGCAGLGSMFGNPGSQAPVLN